MHVASHGTGTFLTLEEGNSELWVTRHRLFDSMSLGAPKLIPMTRTTHWSTGPWLSVDTETTGTSPARDRIVELAAVVIDSDATAVDSYRWIIDPGVPIPAGATNVHGFTNEFVQAEGVDPRRALSEFAELLQQHADLPVVIYNARFDWPLLVNEAARHDVTLPTVNLIDPLVIDKAVDKYRRGPRTLIAATEQYDVDLDANDAHSAITDATVAGQVARKLFDLYPQLGNYSVEEFQDWQRESCDAQTLSYVEYRRRTDPEFSSPTGWPIPDGSLNEPTTATAKRLAG